MDNTFTVTEELLNLFEKACVTYGKAELMYRIAVDTDAPESLRNKAYSEFAQADIIKQLVRATIEA